MTNNNFSGILYLTAWSDKGMERDYQEDDYCVSSNPGDPDSWNIPAGPVSAGEDGIIMAVADGMGGLNAGEVASRTAIGAIRNYFTFNRPSELLKNAGSHTAVLEKCIMDAHSCIVEHARKNPDSEGMGTTLVIAWIVGQHAYVAWCGDSRCYLSRNGVLRQISKDHSYVQELVEGGKITQEDAFFHPNRNIITQSLGDESRPPSPTCAFTDIKNGDKLLLCSDGLNSMLQDVEIESILEYSTGGTANRELVDAANRAGGHDNITVIVAEIGERPAPHSSVNKDTLVPQFNRKQAVQLKNPRRLKIWIPFVIIFLVIILIGSALYWFLNVSRSQNPDPIINTVTEQKKSSSNESEGTENNPSSNQNEDEENKVDSQQKENQKKKERLKQKDNFLANKCYGIQLTFKAKKFSLESKMNKFKKYFPSPDYKLKIIRLANDSTNWYLILSFDTKETMSSFIKESDRTKSLCDFFKDEEKIDISNYYPTMNEYEQHIKREGSNSGEIVYERKNIPNHNKLPCN